MSSDNNAIPSNNSGTQTKLKTVLCKLVGIA